MKRRDEFDVFDIPVAGIFYDDEFNCRGMFTLESVQELANSVQINGLKFPIVVQPSVDVPGILPGFDHRIVAGHRRFIATTRLLRWATIPARVATGLTEREARLFNGLENIERKELNELEEALWIRREFPTATTREVAAELGKYPMWVNRRRILLQQPDEVQQLVAAGRLNAQQVQDQIHPIKSVAGKIHMARKLTEESSDLHRKTRNEYRMLTRPRSRKEISDKIAKMLELGLNNDYPILTRFAAWCGRGISDDELDRELEQLANRPLE